MELSRDIVRKSHFQIPSSVWTPPTVGQVLWTSSLYLACTLFFSHKCFHWFVWGLLFVLFSFKYLLSEQKYLKTQYVLVFFFFLKASILSLLLITYQLSVCSFRSMCTIVSGRHAAEHTKHQLSGLFLSVLSALDWQAILSWHSF